MILLHGRISSMTLRGMLHNITRGPGLFLSGIWCVWAGRVVAMTIAEPASARVCEFVAYGRMPYVSNCYQKRL